ncbi:hypothetical protein [Pseudomonas edaphica]|uniref:hypothetical protein n=1 Tax=Pseudomonas edaphica TaxID=2006980 RepID=UPI003D11CA21
MAYGLEFKNGSDVVTLDSEFSRLVVLFSARYSGGASFPVPITSAEPPLIFAKPDGNGAFQWIRMLGAPGNWTGWLNQSSTPGTYFIAAYESKPTASYGMRLWDGGSKLLFDNGTPCAQITSVITGWNYLGATNTSVGRWTFTWNASAPLSAGNYMLINNIAYDLPGNDTFSKLSCGWNYASNVVTAVLQNIGDFRGDSFFVPLIFAKPIA